MWGIRDGLVRKKVEDLFFPLHPLNFRRTSWRSLFRWKSLSKLCREGEDFLYDSLSLWIKHM